MGSSWPPSHHCSTLVQPTEENARWTLGKAQKAAFKGVKDLLQSTDLLLHLDPEESLILACDASPYGLGAVLSHCMQDGSIRLIAFAYHTLASEERKYSQLDKEAQSFIFGVKRFRQNLHGRQFIIHSYHKPLMYIFDEARAVPLMATAQIQRGLSLLAPTHTPSSTRLERIMPMQMAQVKCQNQLRRFS